MITENNSREMVTFSIRIDRRIKRALDLAAENDDRSRNRIIEHILAERTGIMIFPFQHDAKLDGEE